MIRRPRLALWSVCAITLLTVGCQQPSKNTIAQVDPYVGQRPPPVAQLPDRDVTPEPVRPRPRDTSGSASWIPPGGFSKRWECIVIHHSESDKSTPEGMASWHKQRGWDELGYHFVIGNGIGYGDGKVFVGPRWTKQKHGAHCKVPGNYYNEHGIGICLIGNFESHGPTAKQMETLTKLVTFLTDKCDIPTSKINTHGGITHKTACPGKFFSLSRLTRQLSAISIADGDSADPLRGDVEP